MHYKWQVELYLAPINHRFLPPVVNYTEEQLVSALKHGSRDAFNYLYQNYSAVLFGIIYRVINDEGTSQDVLQDAFVKIWNNVAQYDPAKGRIYTWMMNIARNSAIDKLRSKGEIMKGKIQTGEDVVFNIQNSKGTEQLTDTIGLRKIVGDLRPEYQIIVDLAYFKGYTMDEISKILAVPLGTVKTRMRAALQQLRQHFSN
jgi:RNA polymerase sigma-70 factor (ECF subfamily)